MLRRRAAKGSWATSFASSPTRSGKCGQRTTDLTAAGLEPGTPRLLDLGALEGVRDELVDRLRALRREAEALGARQAASRRLLERMRLEPGRHRWVRVYAADLGEPGCQSWRVRPRLGLLGMLMGWWRVKLSSGCPLAGARS